MTTLDPRLKNTTTLSLGFGLKVLNTIKEIEIATEINKV